MMTNEKVDLESMLSGSSKTNDVAVLFSEAGDPIAGFKVLDTTSDEFRKAKRVNDVENLQRSSARKKPIDLSTENGAGAAVDIMESGNRKLAMAITVGWYGFSADGKPADFSKDALAKMLELRPAWVDKILSKAHEAANFLPSSPTG